MHLHRPAEQYRYPPGVIPHKLDWVLLLVIKTHHQSTLSESNRMLPILQLSREWTSLPQMENMGSTSHGMC